MNRYRPPLTLPLLLLLCAPARGGDSNRVAGTVEPGSNWVLVRYGEYSGPAAYWCHASDCLAATYKGSSRKINAPSLKDPVGPTNFMFEPPKLKPVNSITSVPLFVLIRSNNNLVQQPYYRAVLARRRISEVVFDANGTPQSVRVDNGGLGFEGTLEAQTHLSAGDVVVDDDQGVSEPQKPMSLGVAPGMAVACPPDLFEKFYAAGPDGRFARAFAPAELLLERSVLMTKAGGTPLRAHVQTGAVLQNGQGFDAVAKDVARGNLIGAETLAVAAHAENRAAASAYLTETGTPDQLSQFEQRFLACAASLAGKTDALQAAVAAAAAKPAPFVASARAFTQAEVRRLAETQPAPGTNYWPDNPSRLELDKLDWTSQWKGLVADGAAWIGSGKLPATAPFAIPGGARSDGAVGRPAAALGSSGRGRVAPKSPDDLSDDVRKAIGE